MEKEQIVELNAGDITCIGLIKWITPTHVSIMLTENGGTGWYLGDTIRKKKSEVTIL